MNYTLVAVVLLVVVLGSALLLTNIRSSVDSEPVSRGGTQGIPNEAEDESSETGSESVVDGRALDLSSQGLTKVPEYVFARTDLEALDVSDNNLSGALQAEVRLLTQLRLLNLSGNNFTGVPAEVGQLSALEVLDLSGNPLTGLPHELGNLKNLKVLDLRSTNYSTQDLEVIMRGLPAGVDVRTD